MWIRLINDPSAFLPMQWTWMDPKLVAVSIGVAIITSCMALQMAGLARRLERTKPFGLANISGALALGGGIWCMHFVGMLAFGPCTNSQFGALHSVLSMSPSLLAAWVTLQELKRSQTHWPRLIGVSMVLSLGVSSMHFWGMESSEIASHIYYAPSGLVAAVVLATVLAVAALSVHRLMHDRQASPWLITLTSGTVLGLAVSGMHYVAMGAIYLPHDQTWETDLVFNHWVLVSAAVVVCLLMALMVLAVHVGLRWRHLFEQTRRSEARLRAVVETAVDGIVMIEGNGSICAFNPAAEQLLGWKAEEVMGRNVKLLMDGMDRKGHDGYLQRHLATGRQSIIGSGREVQAMHKDGTVIDVRLAVGRVALADQPVFVGFLTDIRQRKAMEHSLRMSEEQHRTLISNIPGVTFRRAPAAQWTPLFLSTAVEALTGWPAEALLAQPQRMHSLVHPEDLLHWQAAVQAALEAGVSYTSEYRLLHRDGHTHWVRESGRGVYGEDQQLRWIDGVLMDISETKARNAEFEGTVQAINRAVAVLEYSVEGRVLSANENFLTMFGYGLDDVLSMSYRMFRPDDAVVQAQDSAIWQRLQRGEHVSLEASLALGKDGRRLWVQTTFSPILDASGQPWRVTQLLTDVTASRTLAEAMREAKEKAESAAAARSTFLANMSHEIRTPMNAIIGFSEALLETPLQPTQQRYVETVHSSSRSMLRLLNDILDTAKLDKGAVDLEHEDFCLADICHLVVGALRLQAERKQLPLWLDIAPHVPAYLRGDALRIQQIVTNLMGNALKFTETGHVRLAVDYVLGDLILRVEDTGIGIAPDKLGHIFDPFAQADASTTRRYGGTGLGTTIARQLAQLMGGDISVRSVLGQGTCFEVRLPLAAGQAPQQSVMAAVQRLPALHILGVDDVSQNLELLEVVMQRQGHRVTTASDGEQAVALFQRHQFDVVLMDLQMPNMDGLSAARAIRQWEAQQQLPATPIIALSASVLQQDRHAADAAGMDGFAAKPLEVQQLMAEIARVVQAPAPVAHPPLAPAAVLLPHADPLEPVVADWEQGGQLWGDEAALRNGWMRFMAEQHNCVQALQAQADASEWNEACAAVHRMRGAAGNLALPQLYSVLSHLEAAAREAQGPRFHQGLVQLRTALAQLEALLRATETAASAVPEVAAAAPAPGAQLSAEDAAKLHAAVQSLQHALQLGEMDDASLAVLARLLPASAMAPLQAALDMFAMDAALQYLPQLVPVPPSRQTDQ